MSVFHNNALIGSGAGAAAAADFQIDRSLRFERADDAYLSKTFSAGNRKTWTFSCWAKLSEVGTNRELFCTPGANPWITLQIASNNKFAVYWTAGSSGTPWTSDALFRDPSAWYHFVVAWDTTQSTASNRLKVYANGVQLTGSNNYPDFNTDYQVNSAVSHGIGGNKDELGGYLAEIHFVDGTQLAASDFGQYDDNNVWQPKEYSGTYGTNGFKLNFSDNSSAAALGTDSSGNSNTFTVNNLTATARNYTSEGSTSGSFYTSAGGAASKMFDGDASTGAFSQTGTATFTFGGSTITASTSLKVRAFKGDSSGANVLVNGTNISSLLNAQSGGGYSTVNITSTLGGAPINLSNVSMVNAGGGSGNIAQIFVDDVELIDAVILQDGTPSNTDSLIDTPTNYTADSGNNGGNYATFNPLNHNTHSAYYTLSNGNLKCVAVGGSSQSSGSRGFCVSTLGMSSGKYYFELTVDLDDNNDHAVGIATAAGTGYYSTAGNWTYAASGSKFANSGSSASYGASYGNGDTIGVAFNADTGALVFYKNGSSQGTLATVTTGETYFFVWGTDAGTSQDYEVTANFGQRPFAYTPPTGHVSLCTQNLPDPTIADGSTAFDAKLWTGDGSSSRAITGYNFSPDFAWIKIRNDAYGHALFDAVRGPNIRLDTVGTNADQTVTDGLHSFDSNGFTIGNRNTVGENSKTYVGWAWDAGANSSKTYTVKVVSDSGNKYRFDDFGTSAVTLDLEEGSTYVFDQSDSSNSGHPLRFSTTSDGTHNSGTEYTTGVTTTGTPGSAGAKTTIVVGSGVATLYYYCSSHSGMGGQANTNSTAGSSNFDGSIQTTVKANPTAGFSIATYSGSGSSGDSLGHGLNAEPEFVIVKARTKTDDFRVYHKGAGTGYYLRLNGDHARTSGGNWQSVTSTTLALDSDSAVNSSSYTYLALFFAPVAGFSAVGGPYTGTGTTSGLFQYCGFRPRWIMIKSSVNGSTGNGNDWTIFDTVRAPYNETDAFLEANTSNAEYTGGNDQIDILSNGFKPRQGNTQTNHQSNEYIWIAFAENPFSANGGLAR